MLSPSAGTVSEKPRTRGVITGGISFRHDVSILVPHDVRYRVDDGDWSPVTAADGTFGQGPRSGR